MVDFGIKKLMFFITLTYFFESSRPDVIRYYKWDVSRSQRGKHVASRKVFRVLQRTKTKLHVLKFATRKFSKKHGG